MGGWWPRARPVAGAPHGRHHDRQASGVALDEMLPKLPCGSEREQRRLKRVLLRGAGQDAAQEPLWPLGRFPRQLAHGWAPRHLRTSPTFVKTCAGLLTTEAGTAPARSGGVLTLIARRSQSSRTRELTLVKRAVGGDRGVVVVPGRRTVKPPSPAPGSRESAFWVRGLASSGPRREWITPRVAFRVWLLLLSVTCPRFIPAVTGWCVSPLCGWRAFHAMPWPHFVSPSLAGGRLGS